VATGSLVRTGTAPFAHYVLEAIARDAHKRVDGIRPKLRPIAVADLVEGVVSVNARPWGRSLVIASKASQAGRCEHRAGFPFP
jgi:hypothetical protein